MYSVLMPEELKKAFQRSALAHVLHFSIYHNKINAVAAYRGYRDTPYLDTPSTTAPDGRVSRSLSYRSPSAELHSTKVPRDSLHSRPLAL